MDVRTKFLLDSGDPEEYKQIARLAQEHGSELWGSTTNPSLIAKKLAGRKITQTEAFKLQKEIVLQILGIVPGAVSAEVYADQDTKTEDMIQQGQEIATWHKRVVVKLPTNIEGFKARTQLRRAGIATNNTLVFSQQQIFAICLHEQIITRHSGKPEITWPPFISPFVGRLDDIGVNGMDLVRNGMRLKQEYKFDTWMLEASVRNNAHMQEGLDSHTELITAPAKVYQEWFSNTTQTSQIPQTSLTPIPYWQPPPELTQIDTIEQFIEAIKLGQLDITHPLTDKGIVKFAEDWQAIISSPTMP